MQCARAQIRSKTRTSSCLNLRESRFFACYYYCHNTLVHVFLSFLLFFMSKIYFIFHSFSMVGVSCCNFLLLHFCLVINVCERFIVESGQSFGYTICFTFRRKKKKTNRTMLTIISHWLHVETVHTRRSLAKQIERKLWKAIVALCTTCA